MADPGAYWSTVAQLCPVFGLVIVVEGRTLMRNLRIAPTWARWTFGLVIISAASALAYTINLALNQLAAPRPSLEPAPFVTTMLWVVGSLLIISPLGAELLITREERIEAIRKALEEPS